MRHRLLVARTAWISVALLALAITAASTPLLFEQTGMTKIVKFDVG